MPPPRKKRPPPLHVTQHRIEAERVNLVLRTNNNKLASLALEANARKARIVPRAQATTTTTTTTNWHWHCCLNTICFCLLLVLLNLLFMQWLYYESLNLNVKQL